uniref:Uncharacterized protein n=1 Tax=Globodera rostochiensis TaxID=31243 RepID=A0A914HTT6_GLORO
MHVHINASPSYKPAKEETNPNEFCGWEFPSVVTFVLGIFWIIDGYEHTKCKNVISYVNHPAIVPSDESANYGANVDEWIRAWIQQANLWHRNAMFPIPLWNLTHRLENGLSRTNNSIEGWHHVWAGLRIFPLPLKWTSFSPTDRINQPPTYPVTTMRVKSSRQNFYSN